MKRLAFTLIELLVVIAIIGILSGLIVVAMGGITNSANIAKAQVFSNSLRNALMLNLVSEWKLDGNVNDTWSGGNNGTWNGAGGGSNTSPNYRPASECISGQCLNFDGTDDYVDFGAVASLKNHVGESMTISSWIKTNANGIIYSPADYQYYYVEDAAGSSYGKIRLRDSSSFSGYSSIIVNDNIWHSIVLVLDRASAKCFIYIDGVQRLQDIYGPTDTFGNTAESVKIGKRAVTGYLPFNGLMDEFRIYNAAMPTSQIKEQYFSGLRSLLASGQVTPAEYTSRIDSLAQF